MKRGFALFLIFVLSISMISLVSAIYDYETDVTVGSRVHFEIGEFDCKQTLVCTSINNNTEEIILEDVDSGQEYIFDYSEGQVVYRPNPGEYFKKIIVTFSGVDYELYAPMHSSTWLHLSQRYNFCLSDSRYVNSGDSFEIGKGDCKQTFKFESKDEEPLISKGNLELTESTLPKLINGSSASFWDTNGENNPQWGSRVTEYHIQYPEGEQHTVLYLLNYDMLFIKEEAEGECFVECQEDWDCTSWSACIGGQQTRTCTDLNNCGTTQNKPRILISCTLTGVQEITEEDILAREEIIDEEELSQIEITLNGVEITVEETSEGISIMRTDDNSVESSLEIIEKDQKIYVKTSVGDREIKILPEEAISNAKRIENVDEIKIEEEGGKAVYSVSGTKRARLFFIFPITAEVEQKISIRDGDIVSTKRPWWRFFAFGI